MEEHLCLKARACLGEQVELTRRLEQRLPQLRGGSVMCMCLISQRDRVKEKTRCKLD